MAHRQSIQNCVEMEKPNSAAAVMPTLMAVTLGTGSIDFVYIGRILLFLLGMYLLSSA